MKIYMTGFSTVQGYSLYQRDMVGRRGGEVCVYVKSDLMVNMKDVTLLTGQWKGWNFKGKNKMGN